MRILKASILGGIVLFIWSAISWMALPWHMTTIHGFTDEKAVATVIQSNATQSGMYMLPAMQQNGTLKNPDLAKGPMVFTAVRLQGMQASMAIPMIISFITQVIAAFFVAWLLTKTSLNYFGRVGFVLMFAIATAIATQVPYWNWFGFDTQFTLVEMADIVIGWFFAGLVMAKCIRR